MLLRRPTAAHELVHDVHEGIKALVGMRLGNGKVVHSLGQVVHSLDQAEFGLGETAYEVSDASNLRFEPCQIRFQPCEPLLVLAGNGLEAGLGIENELHRLFDVHGPGYSRALSYQRPAISLASKWRSLLKADD